MTITVEWFEKRNICRKFICNFIFSW